MSKENGYKCEAQAHGLGPCGFRAAVACRSADGSKWFACGEHAGFSAFATAPIEELAIADWMLFGWDGADEARRAQDQRAELERIARELEEADSRLEGELHLERLGAALEDLA